MSTTEFNSVDDFLGHSANGRRGGKFMKSWKKQGSCRIFLHTRRLPVAVWRHSVPQLTVFDDKKTGDSIKAFWGRDLGCWENETFLKQQYFRDGDDYQEPENCAICRLINVVLDMVHKDELDWTQPIFKFTGATEAKDNRIIHAGGLTNMFGSKNLSREQIEQLKHAGIRRDQAWGQNMHAKCQYVLTLVDADKPENGVVIDSEPQSVGQKIKKVIADTQASLGMEEGNPFLHPYCIELTFDENATMNEMYNARRIERVKMTPEIERMITQDDPPDLASALRPFNQAALKAFLQEYAVVDLPWDDIFDVPELIPPGDAEEFPPRERTAPKPAAPKATPKPVAKEPESAPAGAATIPCDKCGFAMLETEDTCRKCGAKYELEEDDKPQASPAPAPKGQVKGDVLPFKKSRF